MKRDFKRLFSLMLVVAVLVAAFVFGAAPVAAAGEPFTVGDTPCATWDAAVAAAGEGGTITVNPGADLSGQGVLALTGGVTLDLAGNTLTVDGIVAVAGTNLIDSSAAKTGLLKTAGDVELNPDNSHLPVWTGEGYVLLQPNVSSDFQKFVKQDDGSYYFAFRPSFEKVNGSRAYLATGEHGLRMEFTVLTADGYVAEDADMEKIERYFGDEAFTQVYGDNKMFFVRMRNGESVDQLRVKTAIYSEDTGVRYSSESVTGKAVVLDFTRETAVGEVPAHPTSNGWGIMDTLGIAAGSVSIPSAGTLRVDGTLTATTTYSKVLAADMIYYEVKFSNFNFAEGATTAEYISLRYGNKQEFIQVFGDGSVKVAGQTVGNLKTDGVAELRVAINPSNSAYHAYNATTGTVKRGAGKAYDTGYFALYSNNAGNKLDISNLKIYTDVNATVGGMLQDQKTEQTVTWTWDDGENADKLRPERVTVAIYNGENKVNEANVLASAGTYTFGNLPKFDADGNEITYTAKAEVEHYTDTYADGVLTLKHIPAELTYFFNNDFSGAISTNTDGNRLYDSLNNELVITANTVTRQVEDQNGFMRISFNAQNGTVLRSLSTVLTKPFSVSMKIRFAEGTTAMPGEKLANGTALRFTNGGLTTDGSMVYFYKNNMYVRNGTNGVKTFDLAAAKGWVELSFQMDPTAKECHYKVVYNDGTGASTTSGTFTFTSDLARLEMYCATAGTFALDFDDLQIYQGYETTEVTGNVVWDDADNQDGIRPENVTVNLYNGSILVDSAAVIDGQFSFTGLPKTNATNGQDYTYRVELAKVPAGYTKTVDGNNFTLSHTPTTEDVAVTWTWDDGNDNDELRPENITIGLYVGEELKTSYTAAADALAYTFEGVDIADYVVKVTAVDGYEISVDGYAITLTHEPTITWLFNSAFDTAPAITTGTNYDTVSDGKEHSVTSNTGKVAYVEDGENGFLRYTLNNETARIFYADNYSSTVQVVDISFKVRLISGSFPKQNTVSGRTILRINGSISNTTVPLYFSEDTMYVNVSGNIHATLSDTAWTEVHLHIDAANDVLTYTLNGKTNTIKTTLDAMNRIDLYASGAATVCFDLDDLKISKGIAKTFISGSVAWEHGENDQQPESVTVNLLQNGTEVAERVVNAATDWKYAFNDLLVNDENDAAYTYTVTVDAVDGYEAAVGADGAITLTYVPTDMDVAVTWEWADSDDNDKIRPENITVGLYVGDVKKYEQTVAAEALAYTFEDIEIADYEVRVSAIDGYEITVNDYAVTLTHEATITWYFWHDFESDLKRTVTTTVNGNDTLYDVDGERNITTKTENYQQLEEDGNRFLRFNLDNETARIFYAQNYSSAAQVVDISFSIRWVSGEFPAANTHSGRTVCRIANAYTANDVPLYFQGTTMYVGNHSVDLQNAGWVDVQMHIDASADTFTYTLNNDTYTIKKTFNEISRLDFYVSGAATFTIDMDDLKISTSAAISAQ